MANRGTKTRHMGVYKLSNGNWLIQATARQGDRVVASQKTLPAHLPVREVVAARAELVLALADPEPTGEVPKPPHEDTPKMAVAIQAPPPPRPAATTPLLLLTTPSPELSRTTLREFAERWLARKKLEIRPHTVDDYRKVLEARVLPVLGEVAIQELRRDHVLGWRAWAERQKHPKGGPLAPATLTVWWRVLRVMLNDLIADHGLNTNLTFRVRPPSSTKERVRTDAAMTVEQLRQFLEVVRRHYPAWYAEVYTLAYGGMRPSELYALTWADVDLDQGTLYIGKSYVRGYIGRPKKNRARRISLTGGMVEVLKAHKGPMDVRPDTPVFRGTSGRTRDTTALYNVLSEAGVKAGVPFRVGNQVMRYTANTLLREAGVPDEIVRARLGHVTREMGHLYFKGHIDAQREAADRLAAAVEGRKKGRAEDEKEA